MSNNLFRNKVNYCISYKTSKIGFGCMPVWAVVKLYNILSLLIIILA